MYISQQLKTTNIAEYLLYMWQVEDLIRANNLDMDQIRTHIIERYNIGEEEKRELEKWFADLVEMMRAEGIKERGHLQINKNIIILLTDLHLTLMESRKHAFYEAKYYNALPFIVELRNRGADKSEPEIQTCFEALYGVMLLKLQKKEVSEDTSRAIAGITGFISSLATYYHRSKNGEEFD